MSAKILHSLSDENPDLQKHIGCMTGIFQLFDRHHILTPKRISSYNAHKRPPSGNSRSRNSSHGDESHSAQNQNSAKEKNSSKNANENPSKNASETHRISMESARVSFSSSTCSSSFSSECNKTTEPESSSLDGATNAELGSREPSAVQELKKSSDFRDVVKDSIQKESLPLSVKTTAKEEPAGRVLKYKDSPRPVLLSRSVDGPAERGVSGKHMEPTNMKDSLNALVKLQEAPRYFHDTRERPRLSYEARDRSRFSYDGREIARSSFESRDTFKSTTKLRELPRLSLDSRATSTRGSEADGKSYSLVKDGDKQNHSVVAKLMGLEAMPKSLAPIEAHKGPAKTCFYPGDNHDSLSKSSRITNDYKQNSFSPRRFLNEPISPQLRNPDLIVKPSLNSRFPTEPAPLTPVHGVQKPVFKSHDSPPRRANASPSVYAEIEKRLKELEFKQSDKDLRALKQILDAMQAKGLLETKKKEEQDFVPERNYDDPKHNMLDQNPILGLQHFRNTNPISSTTKGTNSPRRFDSPIVIMKPANYIEKSGIRSSSAIPIHSTSTLRKIQSGNSTDIKKNSTNNRTAKDLTPRFGTRESVKQPLSSTDKQANARSIRSISSPPRSKQMPKENAVGLGRNSGSVSPRLQPKKVDLEKRTPSTTPSSDLSKPGKNSLRQATDSGSPGRRRRPRPLNFHQNDDQMSENSCDTRNTSHQGDEVSARSDSNISLASQMDVEVTSADRSSNIHNSLVHKGNLSPSRKVTYNMISSLDEKKPSPRPSENGSLMEFMTVTPEQPSPVSVLDASFYNDEFESPNGKTSESFKVDDIKTSDVLPSEEKCKERSLSTEMNRKKLENVEELVQKLRRLNSTHDEASTDYIASLCDNTNPDHRYISEILLASGLLLRDLGTGFATIQRHKSGHLINPDLFFVLEQTKARNGVLKDQYPNKQTVHSKTDQERVHRKLMFDSVNEILEEKLASTLWCQSSGKLAKHTLNGQQLLKELCHEIERTQSNESLGCHFDDADDFLKTILCKDIMSETQKWTESSMENSGLVLDIERLIFKDLIDEVISGEASSLIVKPERRRRQLFAK